MSAHAGADVPAPGPPILNFPFPNAHAHSPAARVVSRVTTMGKWSLTTAGS